MLFRRALAAATACCAVACGLDLGGLGELPGDAGTTTTSTPVADATVSFNDSGAGSSPGPEASATLPDDAGSVAPDATADATAPDAAPTPPTDAGPPDVGQPDVHVLDPDAAYLDAGDPCDLDQDGYKSLADGCGGTDCCDYDSRSNPGDTSYYATADSCGSFDYDCNGTADPQYGRASCTVGFFTCNGDGFDQAPPLCGVTATFDTCHLGIGCYTSQTQAAQACR